MLPSGGNVNAESLNTQPWQLQHDDAEGNIILKNASQPKQHLKLSIAKKSDAGDETVPEISGIAPSPFVKELWQQADGDKTHQDSWSSTYAQQFALYVIIKIMLQDHRVEEDEE